MMKMRSLGIGVFLLLFVVSAVGCESEQLKEVKAANYRLEQQLRQSQEANAKLRGEMGKDVGYYMSLAEEREKATRDLQQKNALLNEKISTYENKINELMNAQTAAVLPAGAEMELQALSDSLGGDFELEDSVLRFKSDILFDSGSDVLKPAAKDVIDKIAQILNRPDTRDIYLRVDGHTDSDPIKASKDKFQDNWDLSASRAHSVLVELQKAGIDATRMYIAGFGQYYPRVPNTSKENKQQNRRVEIYLLLNPPVYTVGAATQ